jgi:imidazolonepropionase-like amidohydrolase
MHWLAGHNRHFARLSLLVAALIWRVSSPALAAAAPAVVFRDVQAFDGSAGLPATTVVVEDGKIVQVGPAAAVPAGARVIEGRGKTLLPGLIDAHTHTFSVEHLRQAAVLGVTTELDMFTDHAFAAQMRAEQAAGQARDRADLLSAGNLATAAGGHGTEYGLTIATIDEPAEAQAFVDARIAEGSDYIKIVYDDGRVFGRKFPTITRETLGALVRAAHARKKRAVVHVMGRAEARDALAEGADGLVHIFVDAVADDEFVRLAAEKRAFVVPTLTVLAGGGELADDPAIAPWLAPGDLRMLRTPLPRLAAAGGAEAPAASVRALHARGVRIVAGTDAPNPGTAHGANIHRELELLVAAGLTPAEALAAATAVPAAVFGLADRGAIAPGLRADLVLVDGDPLSDIKATRAIAGVWKQGEPIDRDAYRAAVRKQSEALAAAEAAPAPAPALKSGLVSDFEGDKVQAEFGSGWMVSTDRFVGGNSQAEFTVVAGGAAGSKGSLRVSGTIADRPQPRWAGVLFSPGPAPMAPANLSSRRAITFWARGEGKPVSVMLFFQARGVAPSVRIFVATPEWTRYRCELKDFDGCDGTGVTGLFFGGGADPGPFEFQIDDVRFE